MKKALVCIIFSSLFLSMGGAIAAKGGNGGGKGGGGTTPATLDATEASHADFYARRRKVST